MSDILDRRTRWMLLSLEAKRLWVLDEPDPSDLAGKLLDIAFSYPASRPSTGTPPHG